MASYVRLIGPTLMIFMGLQLFGSVAITFLLFYAWLLLVPFIDQAFPAQSFKVTKQGIILGLASGALFFLFIYGGLNWLHIYFLKIDQLRVLLLDWGFAGEGEFWLVLVLLVANPILEEVYWRGYMHEKLRIQRSAMYTIWLTSCFYTLYHLLSVFPIFQGIYSLIAILPVLAAGLFWGFIREKTGSLTAPIIGHILSDLGIVCVYWFIVR
ncbi:CPBP family intramembrane glutamic endopeptidase [Mesobacillus campisalis]|uniref:CPBP family intramembrane glutamic endopeptidase n=1 Tax=Mesobacillus campisalis TaxID=1408103 RepID=UPI00069C7752|nr:type II CAAX endopeptidase family protein [Mesobacillus campisalis]